MRTITEYLQHGGMLLLCLALLIAGGWATWALLKMTEDGNNRNEGEDG